MPTLFTPAYQRLLQQYREQRPTWGNTGHQAADRVRQLVTRHQWTSVLDYGCGDGSLKAQVMHDPPPSLQVCDEYDPGVVGKDTCPDRVYDLVVCKDVLEHIEPLYLDSVLDHLYALTGHLLLCTIAYVPAPAILPDGRNAHLSLLPPEAWLQRLCAYQWCVVWEGQDHQHCWIRCQKGWV